MASKIECSLDIDEAYNTYSVPSAYAEAGTIQIRINLRYRLCVKARGVELLIDEVFTPEFVTNFYMSSSFLLPGFGVVFVSDMLADLDVDAQVCEFSSPKIAEFAIDVAKRHGEAVSDFMTIARLSIDKIDYILEEEYDRISKVVEEGCAASKIKHHLNC